MSKTFNKPNYDHICGLLELFDTWYVFYQSKSHCTMSQTMDSERERLKQQHEYMAKEMFWLHPLSVDGIRLSPCGLSD